MFEYYYDNESGQEFEIETSDLEEFKLQYPKAEKLDKDFNTSSFNASNMPIGSYGGALFVDDKKESARKNTPAYKSDLNNFYQDIHDILTKAIDQERDERMVSESTSKPTDDLTFQRSEEEERKRIEAEIKAKEDADREAQRQQNLKRAERARKRKPVPPRETTPAADSTKKPKSSSKKKNACQNR